MSACTARHSNDCVWLDMLRPLVYAGVCRRHTYFVIQWNHLFQLSEVFKYAGSGHCASKKTSLFWISCLYIHETIVTQTIPCDESVACSIIVLAVDTFQFVCRKLKQLGNAVLVCRIMVRHLKRWFRAIWPENLFEKTRRSQKASMCNFCELFAISLLLQRLQFQATSQIPQQLPCLSEVICLHPRIWVATHGVYGKTTVSHTQTNLVRKCTVGRHCKRRISNTVEVYIQLINKPAVLLTCSCYLMHCCTCNLSLDDNQNKRIVWTTLRWFIPPKRTIETIWRPSDWTWQEDSWSRTK